MRTLYVGVKGTYLAKKWESAGAPMFILHGDSVGITVMGVTFIHAPSGLHEDLWISTKIPERYIL